MGFAGQCGSPQGACSVFSGLDTLVRPVERCSSFTLHTVCLLQLSCPLPTVATDRFRSTRRLFLADAARRLMCFLVLLFRFWFRQMRIV